MRGFNLALYRLQYTSGHANSVSHSRQTANLCPLAVIVMMRRRPAEPAVDKPRAGFGQDAFDASVTREVRRHHRSNNTTPMGIQAEAASDRCVVRAMTGERRCGCHAAMCPAATLLLTCPIRALNWYWRPLRDDSFLIFAGTTAGSASGRAERFLDRSEDSTCGQGFLTDAFWCVSKMFLQKRR